MVGRRVERVRQGENQQSLKCDAVEIAPRKLTVDELVDQIRTSKRFGRNITACRVVDEQPGRFAGFPESVDPRIVAVLRQREITGLYTHQRETFEAVYAGNNPVVVTPTASGKTLCYNLPVLNRVLKRPETRALYLFPTKALSQDQMHALQSLITDLDLDIKTFTYDGDTPADARAAIREYGHIVLTNPDMLHTAILPHHTKWQMLFSNLHFVVIDEMHTYRGVFGSHFTNLMRRLKRICRFYNSNPSFILCSATIANPAELSSRLIEEDIVLIEKSGAPIPRKYVVLYNPPVVNSELGIRASFLNEARHLATLCLRNELQTIVFTTSRLNVEVLTKYLKDKFDRKEIESGSITGYRGGYLPRLRRRIEQGLRDRSVMGVVSTNALELGIDVGALEVSILAGYPGTIASTWQQSGRAGRRKGSSLSILVSRSNPLDQFMVNNPDYLFGRPPEHGRINPDNLLILVSHIKCAAFELPFETEEFFGTEDLGGILSYLEEKGILHRAGTRFHWSAESYPANEISLRSVTNQNFVIVDTSGQEPQVIAEADYTSAPFMIHKDAIYMVESRQYHVDELDWERCKAYVHPVSVDYYTDAMSHTNVKVLDEFESARKDRLLVEHGEVQVVSRVVGFKKIRYYTSENVGYGEVNIPEDHIHTTAYWFTIPLHVLEDFPYSRAELVDGLLGIGYLLHHVAAIHLMCDLRDINYSVGDKSFRWFVKHEQGKRKVLSVGENREISPDTIDAFDPSLFIYDNYPGGVGFSPKLFDLHGRLLSEAMTALDRCTCKKGCPSCVGPASEMGILSKDVALALFHLILKAG